MKRQLLSALLPLVLFWAIEEFWGLKAALIAGCAAAVLEIAWEKIRQGRVSFMTLAANLLVLGLGAVSYAMQSGVAFKLQPAVMEVGMAGFMAAMRVRGEPFMVRTFRDIPTIEQQKRELLLGQSWFMNRLVSMDTRLVVFFILHGLAVGWAAVWGTTRIWILLKGVLFYVLLVLVMVPMYKRPQADGTTNPPV